MVTDYKRDAHGNVVDEQSHLFRANKRTATLAEVLAGVLEDHRPEAPLSATLTGEAWRGSCRGAGDGSERCGACVLCKRDAETEARAFAAPWSDTGPIVERERTYTWTSVVAALAAYATHRLDGYSNPSATGPILERLRDGMTQSMGGGGTDYHGARTDLAGALGTVREVLLGAYAREQDRHGLSARDCLRILFARTVGDEHTEHKRGGHSIRTRVRVEAADIAASLGVSEREVESIAKHGRDCVYVGLAARELLPEPRLRARLRVETLTLRERLLRRRCR